MMLDELPQENVNHCFKSRETTVADAAADDEGGQVIAQDAPVALSLFWPHINSEFLLLFSLHI
jgi:hypothetical protein